MSQRFSQLIRQVITESQFRWPFGKATIIASALLMANSLLVLWLYSQGWLRIDLSERGYLENLQRICLLCIFVVAVFGIIRQRAVFGILFNQVFMACLSLAVFSRETPFCNNQFELSWSCAGRVVQPGISAVAIGVFAIFFIWQLSRKPLATLFMVHPRMGWPIILAFCFVIAGQFFEKTNWIIAEEMFEFSGFVMFLFVTIASGFFLRADQVPR